MLLGRRRAIGVVILAAALALAPTPAHAHQRKIARTFKLEPTADTLLVWVSITVPPGRGKETMLALADASRDGTLDPTERQRLERTLAVRALDGVALLVGGATRALDRAELKLSAPAEKDASIELVILGSVPLGPTAQSLALNVIRSGDPISLGVLAGERPVTRSSRGTVVAGGVDTVMGSPDRVSWTIAPAP